MSPDVFGSSRVEAEMFNLAVMRVGEHGNVADRITVYTNATFGFDRPRTFSAVADVSEPFAFALKKLDVPDMPFDRMKPYRDRNDFFLEKRRHAKPSRLKLDLFAFDPFCPDIIGCSLFLPAYELDE